VHRVGLEAKVESRIFTLGYEGLSIDAFISRLKAHAIGMVVDVRELPLSRKPGFSKKSFAQKLNQAGIGYAHLPALGCPRPIRDRYKADGDWATYAQAFNTYLSGQEAAVAEVVRIANAAPACLVCFEANFERCHRSMVARAAAYAAGTPEVHLMAKAERADLSVLVAA